MCGIPPPACYCKERAVSSLLVLGKRLRCAQMHAALKEGLSCWSLESFCGVYYIEVPSITDGGQLEFTMRALPMANQEERT